MKNYKKGFLTIAVLSAMSLMAAEDTTIYVNTFEDQDIDDNKCSLREAVVAASKHVAYHGCPKGKPHVSTTNVIQLEAGTYTLKSELVPTSAMVILGKEPADWSKTNVISNEYPAQTPIKTIISGNNTSRIFNTSNLDKPTLSLQDLILTQGKSNGDGGALSLGGITDLTNVSITDSNAIKGGAIYLSNAQATLTVSGGQFKGNKADSGSVLAMSCSDNLGFTKRSITLSGSSYIANGSGTSKTTFAFCGEPSASVYSNTITENIASSTDGSIIKFNSTQLNNEGDLSSASKLALLSNTIVKNSAQSIFAYNQTGTKNVNYNVLAFNTGKSCAYTAGNIATVASANISVEKNALMLDAGNDQCELPTDLLKASATNTLDLKGIKFEDILNKIQDPVDFTNYMSMYFPIERAVGQIDLVDSGSKGCAKLDQRGFSRISEITSDADGVDDNTCDIGAIEVLRFSVGNIAQSNQDLVKLVQSYQDEIDVFKPLISDSKTKPEYLPFYRIQLSLYENLKAFTKSDQKYRPIYFDPFQGNLPDEVLSSGGARQILHLNTDNYDVLKPEVLGIGKLDTNKKFLGVQDANLRCVWDADLKKITMYRTDDRLTPSGDAEFCKYTLKSKSSGKIASGYLIGTFINIGPNVPAETSYVVEHGGLQKVNVDLLKNANDDGDGSTSSLENQPKKSPFYLNAQGQQQAIRFNKIPDSVTVTSERSGPCPGTDEDRRLTCHGGAMTMQLNNTLDPFNYTVTYVVYDMDTGKSGEGKVLLKNTASAPGSVRQSGGGSMGWMSLLGLIGLTFMRYRSRTKLS